MTESAGGDDLFPIDSLVLGQALRGHAMRFRVRMAYAERLGANEWALLTADGQRWCDSGGVRAR